MDGQRQHGEGPWRRREREVDGSHGNVITSYTYEMNYGGNPLPPLGLGSCWITVTHGQVTPVFSLLRQLTKSATTADYWTENALTCAPLTRSAPKKKERKKK